MRYEKKVAFKAVMQKIKKNKCRTRYNNDLLHQFINLKKDQFKTAPVINKLENIETKARDLSTTLYYTIVPIKINYFYNK